MNVASLDLCEILSKLSGWDETHHRWSKDIHGKDVVIDTTAAGTTIPAYDLGYLMRKFVGKGGIEVRYGDKGCVASSQIWVTDAPTPEDAVCKLCCIFWTHGLFK